MLLRWTALALPAALSVPLVLGFLGAWHPALDSFSHFRAHLAAALLVAAIPALLLGGLRATGVMAMVLALTALGTAGIVPLPFVGPASALTAKPAERPAYRLLHLNLRFNNPTPEKVISLIARTSPDVITLNEVSATWAARLETIAARYPYRILCDPYSRGAAAILSRRPFARDGKGACDPSGAMATATVDFGGPVLDVVALHLKWPWPFGQPEEIAMLASRLSELSGTALIAGDLNAAPWSHAVRQVSEIAGAERIPGSGATWLWRRLPAAMRPYVGLPIDHVFAKGAIAIHAIDQEEPVGSDHAPLLLEFSLRAGARPPTDDSATAMAAADVHANQRTGLH